MDSLNQRLKKDPLLLLRCGLGLVFILAGLHRLIFFDLAYQNFLDVGLRPAALLVALAIGVELVAGVLLLWNLYVKEACMGISILLVIGIASSAIRAGHSLIDKVNELFMLTYTPTNIVLHVTYLVGVITLLLWVLPKKKKS